ncbi:MAG: recombinase family protein [Acetobacteraceae bacterium]|nr:recombinase family protein [Acetobacteraceae bacterium]
MPQNAPHRAAALYCRPTFADPACAEQRRALDAHVQQAGHIVHGAHHETHPDTDVARCALLDLARAGQLDAVLVARLAHCGRSLTDLLMLVSALHAHRVALHALAGPRLDLAPPHGEHVVAALSAACEIERELRQCRAHRAHAAARAAGRPIGRQPGQRPKADRLAPEVLALAAQGLSQRAIAARLRLSKNTVGGILSRARGGS